MKRLRKLIDMLVHLWGRPALVDEVWAAALARSGGKLEIDDIAVALFERWGSISEQMQAAPRFVDLSIWRRRLISNALTDVGFRSDDETAEKVFLAWQKVAVLSEITEGNGLFRKSRSSRDTFVN